jgi:hypothetical protein
MSALQHLIHEQLANRGGAHADLAHVRQQARVEGYQLGFDDGANWAFGLLTDAGVDIPARLALTLTSDTDEGEAD